MNENLTHIFELLKFLPEIPKSRKDKGLDIFFWDALFPNSFYTKGNSFSNETDGRVNCIFPKNSTKIKPPWQFLVPKIQFSIFGCHFRFSVIFKN